VRGKPDGDLIYTFTQPWSDGTTGIKLSPLELLDKLALIFRPGAIGEQFDDHIGKAHPVTPYHFDFLSILYLGIA
jgi:hypothetical protein